MKLSGGEKAVAALVAVLGLIGFGISFHNVAEAVRPSFGDLAPAVPLGVDVGIAAFTGLDMAMARRDMRTRWLRLFPWLLILTTVYLNVAQEPTLYGQVAHGVLPLLFVVLVEAGAHVVRSIAGLTSDRERMDRIRPSRWLLAPFSTASLWRDMVLWEVRSYRDALERKQTSLLAVCDLHEQYGRWWKWKAPRRDRVLYKLGRLTPERARPTVVAPAIEVALEQAPRPKEPKLNGDLDSAARQEAEAIKANGGQVSRRALQAALKSRGYSVGTSKAAELSRRHR